MATKEIDIDEGERNICRNCIDEIEGQGKSEISKKMGDNTVYCTDESEENEEYVEGTVLGGGGDEVSITPVVNPHGMVSVSSLCYFSSVGSSSKPYNPSVTLSLGVHHIREYFKKKRGRK